MSEVGERELLAIIFTDAVDSTARTATDEDYSLRILLADLDYMRNEAAVRGGTVLKNTGDGLLISFKSGVDAVECALSIQRGFANRSENSAFSHKIGVHIGDVIKKDGDIYGSGVNTASRLVAQCPAGGLCMSSTLYELVKQKSQISQLNLKDFQLTNIEPPIKAYRLEGQVSDAHKNTSKNESVSKNKKKNANLSLFFAVVCGIGLVAFILKTPISEITKTILNKYSGDQSSIIVGQWKWLNGNIVTLASNGSCWGAGPLSGRWEYLGDKQFKIIWGNDEWIDLLQIDSHGNHLQGHNQIGGAVSASKISSKLPDDVANSTSYSLSGIWVTKGYEKSTTRMYLTQVGKKVFWYQESGAESPTFANVCFGEITGNNIYATYADVPKGGNRCNGSLKFQIKGDSELYLQESSGGWPSGFTYLKLP